MTEPKARIISRIVLVSKKSPSRDSEVQKTNDAVGVSAWERTTVNATGLGLSKMKETRIPQLGSAVAGLYNFHDR